MNNEDRLRAASLHTLNEKFKSVFLDIAPTESAAADAVKSSPPGHITSEALTLMQRALSLRMLYQLQNEVNDWFNDELSYTDCKWDEKFLRAQKMRLFIILSGADR